MKRILFGLTIVLAGLFLAVPVWAQHNSLNFDGVNDYIAIPHNAALSLTTQATFETWIKVTNTSPITQYFCTKMTYCGNPGGYKVGLWGSQMRLIWGNNVSSYFDVTSTTSLITNTWYHVAVTYDGTNVKWYINGNLDKTSAASAVLTPTADSMLIGRNNSTSTYQFFGSLDRFRIWNYARSQAEIQASMNSVITPGTSGLVAQYTFNQGVADGDNSGITVLYDSSGAYGKSSPIDGTLRNFALTGSTSNWVVSAAPSAVELCSFTATGLPGKVEIAWSTASESNSASWMVERSLAADNGYSVMGKLPASGNASSGSQYSFVDGQAEAGVTYYYKIAEQELDGKITYYGPVSASAGVSLGSLENQVSISPNPCTQFAMINYQLAQPGMVSARIYNMLGQQVRTVFSGSRQAGAYSVRWDGRNAKGQAVPAGVYVLKFSAGEQMFTKRITLLK
ncbi:T9SS type A sorting domain-containing protein [candidate division TA06 bacterium]|nr:T9SS type A sorting domain-containing protein [candidate division TA06 bacterium]